MPRKVLIIGCSHSAGSYDNNDGVVSNESWAWHLQHIRDTDDQYYVIHNPGNGIIHYGAIVKYLKAEGLLRQFDACIIQLTAEMRMMLYDKNSDMFFPALKEWMQTANDKFNQRPDNDYMSSKRRAISYYDSDVYDKHESKFVTTKSKEAWLDVSQRLLEGVQDTYIINAMYDAYYSYIVSTLIDCNVEPIVFDWWGKVENHSLEKDSEWILDSVMETAKSREMWHTEWMTPVGQHHNSKSAKLMAEIINEAIISHGKLQ